MSGANRRRRRPRGPRPIPAGLVLPLLLASCGDALVDPGPGAPPPGSLLVDGVRHYTYEVIVERPHDPDAFTQGLVLHDGDLLESTGLFGRSSLRRVDRATGEVLQRRDLEPELFGEGIAVWEDRIVQLTWQAGRGFVYDLESFAVEDEFSYTTEGWGLTHDGVRLIMSDGTSRLRFLDPETKEPTGEVSVSWEDEPVERLNELEYVEGHVFANVWLTDRVAIIDPEEGEVAAWLDLEGLLPPEDRAGADVLNGIAFDREAGRLLVTGKLWPRLFEIELVPLAPG